MAAPWKQVHEDGSETIRTCAWSPPGCHPVGCGIKLTVKDGVITNIEGDPEHPITQGRLCPRCLALKDYIYNKDRIIHPMKRAVEDRGKDKWEQISWDEAYAMIKSETERITEKWGAESILFLVGTGRLAVMIGHLVSDVAFCTPNYCYTQSGFSCYGPRIAVCSFLAGVPIIEIDYAASYPDRYDNPEFDLPEYIVLWGKQPLVSNPDGFFGHSVIDMMKRGSKLVMIDPRMNWLATRAEEVLRVRPGSDTALALAMCNVIITEDLYDHDFVDKWVYGWDEFTERVQQYPVDWAAETTGIPAEQIYRVARKLAAAHPVTWGWGVAFDQNVNGVQLAQCFMALIAMTGNLDIPGGTLLGKVGWDTSPVEMTFSKYIGDIMDKRVGLDKHPAVCTSCNVAAPDDMLLDLENDAPVKMRMCYIGSTNLITATNSAQPGRWHDAMLKRMEFTVAQDTFMNPTIMALADLFLPLATFAEMNYYVVPNYGSAATFLGAINKAVTVGEAKSEVTIALELIELLHPEFGFPFKTAEELATNDIKNYPGHDDFTDLQNEVVFQPDVSYRKYETGELRSDHEPGFETPTGKLELYSTVYESFGDDPLPYYEEPRWSNISHPENRAKYPYILTTGQRDWMSFHSEHRQIEVLRNFTPDPLIEINPLTAKKLGIKNGDWVWIENMFGKCKERAKITPIIRPDTVAAAHGWWFPEESPEEPHLFGVWTSNINELIPACDTGIMGFGSPYKNMCCNIYKVEA